MGIPSYYKKLIDTIPGLVSREKHDVDWLFMDFNCLIYHCINDIYPGESKRNEWETQFIESIITYCLKVIKEVNPKGVFIAIDGVVPMAKMRQQRLRRFKSAWMPQTELKWDKNAITPGTVFMSRLTLQLEHMISTHENWFLSSSDEPGEGEHKIIAQWRKGIYKGNYAVYGLDADLIVLSMLGHECCNLNHIWLFREDIHAGKVQYDSFGEEMFCWFSIHLLKNWLMSTSHHISKRTFILNYCFALSVLGNDFLPTSLGLKMREDGHAELLDSITSLQNSLIDPITLTISFTGVVELFRILCINEPSRICKYINKKQMCANHIDSELNIGENNWPLSHVEESILLEKRKLCTNWQEKYMTFFHGFDIHRICKEYLYGIQWIWSYYTGQEVCFNWYYPHSVPPLWEWIYSYLHTNPLPLQDVLLKATDITPVEQLTLVLPLESWSLVPPCTERILPFIAPHYYPATFTFESVGKRYFWECEAMIPMPNMLEIKEIVKHYTLRLNKSNILGQHTVGIS